jgi:hypothetical protein
LAGEPVSPQSRYEPGVDEVDGEAWPPPLPRRDDEPSDERHDSVTEDAVEEPEFVTSGGPVAEEEWVTRGVPVEETVVVGTNGASSNGLHDASLTEEEPPETIPGEEDLSPEMASFLRSRRRDKKDNPFRGFDSPPGRF